MKLFYDMTFELGEMFVTILTFTNYFYVGCPVMPLAVNIHERKFKSRYGQWGEIGGKYYKIKRVSCIKNAEVFVNIMY